MQHWMTPPAAETSSWDVQGLKVRFSGVKPAAAASAGTTTEAKRVLSKEEEKKQARLRKAQRALGL